MAERRTYLRTPFRCAVKIWHDTQGEMILHTRDISHGGIFLIADPGIREILPMGDIIKGQIQGMMDDAPIVTMKVVHADPDGIGLEFILETK